MAKLLPALVLGVLAAAGSAQQASFTNYGRGCDLPSNPPPLIRNTGLPQLGASFTVRYIGPNSVTPVSRDQPVLLTGLGRASLPIPPITSLQPKNCLLLVVPWFSVPMPLVGSRFQDQFTVRIPNNPALLGATYFQQWATIYSRCTGSCVVQMVRMSDVAEIIVGR